MKTIAFGPLRKKIVGSWRWFGQDLAQELSKYYKIVFATVDKIPKCDLIFVVKLPQFLKQAVATKIPVIYVTIDVFHSKKDINNLEPLLNKCTVINQCHFLCDLIPKSSFIPHHIKYITDSEFKTEGSILWVGGSQYKKTVQRFIQKVNLEIEIDYLCGKEWSPENQLAAQETAKAAIDIKGDIFWQRMKPATKIVDFLASGLPVAANENCSAVDYFYNVYNFRIPDPTDYFYWFSHHYYDLVQELKPRIRHDFSLNQIGLQYKRLIDNLLN